MMSTDLWLMKKDCTTSLEGKLQYCIHKRNYRNAIKQAKRSYNERKIKNAKNKPKAAWQVIGANKSQKKKEWNNTIEHNGLQVQSQDEIANLFNDHFSNVVTELLTDRNPPKPQEKYINKYHDCRMTSTIFLYPISRRELYEICDKALRKFSAGYDEVPASILKPVITFIAEPLIFMINRSFEQGVFPEELKKSIIIPCFKQGDTQKINNYRPVALLSVFSKIFELAMCNRLVGFLNKNNLLNDSQHGFIKGRSTVTAIANFVSKILHALENRENNVGIFYDFSKAFDTVNHTMLLQKLDQLGIAGVANKWIESFIKNRRQIVKITSEWGTCNSKENIINVGVPQGATISPILFILYTNDIAKCLAAGSLTLYADDTSHFIKGQKELVIDTSRKEIKNLEVWCEKNDLFINKNKTVFMQFSAKKTILDYSPLLLLEGTSIKECNEVKFLGLIMDNKLDWNSHISSICSKVASGCYLIQRIKDVCNLATAKMIYFAYVHSHISYGIILWGNSAHVGRLFILQKRALRILGGASKDPCADVFFKDSCKDLFRHFKILTLPCLYIYSTIMFVIANNHLVTDNHQVHSHNTRTAFDIYIVNTKLNMVDKCPIRSGSLFYNHLPMIIKEQKKNYVKFKQVLTEYLIKKCFYTVTEYLCDTM
jgi:hypothetical protein